jgi:hypothetical protein
MPREKRAGSLSRRCLSVRLRLSQPLVVPVHRVDLVKGTSTRARWNGPTNVVYINLSPIPRPGRLDLP